MAVISAPGTAAEEEQEKPLDLRYVRVLSFLEQKS
jgi:hypothetical protein